MSGKIIQDLEIEERLLDILGMECLVLSVRLFKDYQILKGSAPLSHFLLIRSGVGKHCSL